MADNMTSNQKQLGPLFVVLSAFLGLLLLLVFFIGGIIYLATKSSSEEPPPPDDIPTSITPLDVVPSAAPGTSQEAKPVVSTPKAPDFVPLPEIEKPVIVETPAPVPVPEPAKESPPVTATKPPETNATEDPIHLAGVWSLKNPKRTYVAMLISIGPRRFRLVPRTMNYAGVYELRDNKLVMTEPVSPAYKDFIWQIQDADHLLLTNSSYRGSTMTRQK